MVAPSQSITVPPTVRARAVEVRRPLAVVVAQHAMPLVTAAASAALTTLAVERAIAGLALRTAERTGLVPRETREGAPAFTRITVTRTTVVERITTRRA
jgi:hypothetical protein